MSKPLPVLLNQGLNTAKGDESVGQGELLSGVGIYYKLGDPQRIHKIEGRSEYATVLDGSPIKGAVAAVVDSGVSRILAYVGSGIYAIPLSGETSASLVYSSWSASGTLMNGIHDNDSWILYNGVDGNTVYQNDGTFRNHGMLRPTAAAFSASGISAAAGSGRPASPSGLFEGNGDTAYSGIIITLLMSQPQLSGWYTYQNPWYVPLYAGDTEVEGVNVNTFGYAINPATNAANYNTGSDGFLVTIWSGFPAGTTANRRLYIKYEFEHIGGDYIDAYYYGELPFLKLEYSQDQGVSWTQLIKRQAGYEIFGWEGTQGITTISTDVLSGNSDQVQVRGAMWCPHLTFNQWISRIYDIRISEGGGSDISLGVSGVTYGYTEYNSETNLQSTVATMPTEFIPSGYAGCLLTLPQGPTNDNATQFFIYRTFIGGVAPDDYTKIGELSISGIKPSGYTFTDTFEDVPLDDVSLIPYPMLRVVDTYYDRDVTPLPFIHINEFKGSHVSVSSDPALSRTLFYTPKGFKESYPAPYRISSFPMPEKDSLVGTISMGDTLIVLAEGGVLTLDDIPLASNEGVLNDSDVRRLDGQPGCVGYRAFTSFSVDGPPRAAWVSKFGVHITTGAQAQRISDDIDWSNTVNVATLNTCILSWDTERMILRLDYDSDGNSKNDSTLFFHMSPEHLKANQRPKVTGPHRISAAAITTAERDGIPTIFTAHPTNGCIYREWDGVLDDSLGLAGNTVVDASFEGNGSDWTLAGDNTEITSTYGVHSGNKACVLYSINQDFGADVTGTVTTNTFFTVTSGETYGFSSWVNATNVSGNAILTASYSFNGTDFTDLATITSATVGSGWYKWDIGNITASDDDLWIKFSAAPPSTFTNSRWVIDDIRVGVDVVPLTVTTGKIYDDTNYDEFNVFKSLLRHSDWGGTLSLKYAFGRDHNNFSSSVTKTVDLSGRTVSENFIGRQGQWCQLTLTHTTSGTGDIADIWLHLQSTESDAGNR